MFYGLCFMGCIVVLRIVRQNEPHHPDLALE